MSKIYFFNGWGMDKNLLNPVKNSTEYDIEVINFPYNIDINSIDEDDIFIGYSFGVYYLNKFLSENRDLKYKRARLFSLCNKRTNSSKRYCKT